MNNLLMKSLPMVASVLGRKCGIKIRIGGSTACTDGTTIQLPSLPLDCDQTFTHLVRGYIDHEAAHIRETRFDLVKQAGLTPFEKHIWNTFEDWRVEARLGEIFPGCRQNFHWLITHHFNKDDHVETEATTAILNWLLLSVRSWTVPELEPRLAARAFLIEQAFPGLVLRLEDLLERVRRDCRSTEDCIRYAREVAALLQSLTNASGCPEKASPGTEKVHPDGTANDEKQKLRKLIQASENELPKAVGEALASALEHSTPKESKEAIQVAQPGSKEHKQLHRKSMEATRRATTTLRARLLGLLQAQITKQDRIGRRGRLDTRLLHRAATSDTRMFRQSRTRQGTNTAVHILMDCSGSMRRRLSLTVKTCYAVTSALAAIDGINVGVTIFPAASPDGEFDLDHPHIFPLIRHGERIHSRFAMLARGETPMGEALWWVLQQMAQIDEPRKLILILTDGNPGTPSNARRALEEARRSGFEIYGLGIKSYAISDLLPNASRVINDLNELAPAMFDLLQRSLLTPNH